MARPLFRRTFLAVGLTVAGSLGCAHVLAALILPKATDTVSLELMVPAPTPEALPRTK